MAQLGRRRLGRGLAALIGDDASEEGVVQDARSLRHLPIEFLRRNPANPRSAFREEDLEELAQSIRSKGLLQPLVVRPVPGAANAYEIVAGERRWRAAQRAGVHDMPAIVRELSDGEALEIALVENLQRTDLGPLEEARAYQQLIDRFGHSQQQLADAIGKSRSHIANTLRLLTLPESVRQHVEEGALTAGHARALVTSDSPAELARRIIELGLTVRDAEDLARGGPAKDAAGRSPSARRKKDADTLALERNLAEALGLKVEINHRGKRGGEVRIRYRTLEQLDEVCRRLSHSIPTT